MSELPPLPDTDNPFALLGLTPSADEREIKRAYAHLIKRYRPERAPGEFKRIRAAYDAALSGNQGAWLSTEYEVDAAESLTPRAVAPDPLFPASTESSSPTRDGHVDDEPVATNATLFADHEPAQAWTTFCMQTNEAEAAILMGEHVEELLLQGLVDQALAEVSVPEFTGACLSDPSLEAIALQVCCAAAWNLPTQAARIFDRIAPGEDTEHEHLVWCYEEAVLLSPEWRSVRQWTAIPPELEHYLLLAPLVTPTAHDAIAMALGQELQEMPDAYRQCFDVLAKKAEPIVHHFLRVAGDRVDLELSPETIPPCPDSAFPILDRHFIDIEQIIENENGSSTGCLLSFLFAVTLGGVVRYLKWSWWSLLAGIVLLVVATTTSLLRTAHTFREVVKPRVTLAMVQLEVPLDVFLAWLREHPVAWKDLKSHVPDLTEDLTLMAIGAINLLARTAQGPAGNH